jgi:hypothetical protein
MPRIAYRIPVCGWKEMVSMAIGDPPGPSRTGPMVSISEPSPGLSLRSVAVRRVPEGVPVRLVAHSVPAASNARPESRSTPAGFPIFVTDASSGFTATSQPVFTDSNWSHWSPP